MTCFKQYDRVCWVAALNEEHGLNAIHAEKRSRFVLDHGLYGSRHIGQDRFRRGGLGRDQCRCRITQFRIDNIIRDQMVVDPLTGGVGDLDKVLITLNHAAVP